VKLHLAVAGLCEHAIEHDEVVVGVDVEGRAEAVEEAYGSELASDGVPGLVRRSVRGYLIAPLSPDLPREQPEGDRARAADANALCVFDLPD
jgi:hypothetical protein